MRGAHLACLIGGIIVGWSVTVAHFTTLDDRHRLELRAARLTAVVQRSDDSDRYTRELESCQGANAELAQVLHQVVAQQEGCRGFLRLAKP